MKVFFHLLSLLILYGVFSFGSCDTPPSLVEASSADDQGEEDYSNMFFDELSFQVWSSCEDIPAAPSVFMGSINFTGAMNCSWTKILHILSGSRVTIHAEHDLATAGIHFIVEPGATVVFMSGGDVFFERREEMKNAPVILVGGKVIVRTGAYIPGEREMVATLSSPAEDEQSLLEIVKGGAVYADQRIGFKSNAITVAAPSHDTSKATRQKKVTVKGGKERLEGPGHKFFWGMAMPERGAVMSEDPAKEEGRTCKGKLEDPAKEEGRTCKGKLEDPVRGRWHKFFEVDGGSIVRLFVALQTPRRAI